MKQKKECILQSKRRRRLRRVQSYFFKCSTFQRCQFSNQGSFSFHLLQLRQFQSLAIGFTLLEVLDLLEFLLEVFNALVYLKIGCCGNANGLVTAQRHIVGFDRRGFGRGGGSVGGSVGLVGLLFLVFFVQMG